MKGRIRKRPICTFRYEKRLSAGQGVICRVTVFLLEVKQQLEIWPEKQSRQRCWLAPGEAADRVEEEELRTLLVGLSDRLYGAPSLSIGLRRSGRGALHPPAFGGLPDTAPIAEAERYQCQWQCPTPEPPMAEHAEREYGEA